MIADDVQAATAVAPSAPRATPDSGDVGDVEEDESTGIESSASDRIVEIVLASLVSGEDDCPTSDPLASAGVFELGVDAPHPSVVAVSTAPDMKREMVLCMTTVLGDERGRTLGSG